MFRTTNLKLWMQRKRSLLEGSIHSNGGGFIRHLLRSPEPPSQMTPTFPTSRPFFVDICAPPESAVSRRPKTPSCRDRAGRVMGQEPGPISHLPKPPRDPEGPIVPSGIVEGQREDRRSVVAFVGVSHGNVGGVGRS